MMLNSGARRGRGRHGAPISEINVTPLVDVMLVLLIVFMVTAPLLTAGVPIDLPETAAPQMPVETRPLTVSISPGGGVFLGEDEIGADAVVAAVDAAAGEAGKEQRLYIRGDAAADYGLIMQVMGDLAAAGYARIGLITTQRRGE